MGVLVNILFILGLIFSNLSIIEFTSFTGDNDLSLNFLIASTADIQCRS